ncbi:MAG: AAA family ATPase [Rhodobacteraceae bacterium]|nr:AAA family ATPase [Paracoccaceae bacterium]MYF46959.1 AAA family ATPase [Paracoccaceae bacterium]MYI90788.1 AAA family ATPase [Paracoccaceae bacterium]
MSITITREFKDALELLKHGREHLFITGKAGTGKSTLLKLYQETIPDNSVILAPTGIAALNVGGQTIHRFFKFRPGTTPENVTKTFMQGSTRRIIRNLDAIIIDEVSMLRADLLDCVDKILRKYGWERNKPFGGIRMIFFGDLYQLPPVVPRNERNIFQKGSLYETEFFFDAHVMKEVPFLRIELTKVFRQKDEEFIDFLNRIRENSITSEDIEWFNRQNMARFEEGKGTGTRDYFVILTSTNRQADEINLRHLDKLGQLNPIYKNSAEIVGKISREMYSAPEELVFCRGCQVMMLTNDRNNQFVNGTLGIIQGCDRVGGQVEIKLRNGKVISVGKHKWEVNSYGLHEGKIVSVPEGSFTQFPFRLCWAITIHKSQGNTFENLGLMLGRAFAPGQTYVALSRCTTLEGIKLFTEIQMSDIMTDPRIVRYFERENIDFET